MDHELLAEGLGWAEGPTLLADGRICFVETYRSQISVWEQGKGVSRYAYTAGGPNSCVLGADGVLYACQNGGTTGPWRAEEMVTPSIQRIEREGGPAEIIATELDGKRFNGPNDLVFGPDGRLYFTDPGTYRPDDPEPSYLFVLEADGSGRLLRVSLVEEQDSRALALFDADDDGDVDIFFGRYDAGIHRQGTNQLLLNEGNRLFRPARLGDEVPEIWRTTWHLGLGDFDADGDEDVFTLDATLDDQNPYGTLWFGMTQHLRAPDLLRIGRTFHLELHGAALGGAIYGSPALGRVDLPHVGRFGLDPGTTAMFGTYGAPSQGRRVDVDLRVPAEPALLGVQYGFQGLVLEAASTVRLTNRLVDRFIGQ